MEKDIIFRVINILNKPEEKIAVLNGVIEKELKLIVRLQI